MANNLRLRKISLLFLIGLSYIWIFVALRIPVELEVATEAGRQIFTLVMGGIFGLLGVTLLWWQFLLGARGLVSKLIPDLIWVNNLHKWIGKYGFLQITIHPILILIAYNQPLSFWTQFEQPFDYFAKLGTLAYLLVGSLWVTGAFFRKKLGYRNWKRAHFMAYLVLPLVIIHGLNIGTLINSSELLRSTWIFYLVTYVLVVVYRILSQLGLLKYNYELVGKTAITANVTKFDFAPIGRFKIRPQPGQFLYLQFTKFGESHPFTISHFDEESGIVSVSIKSTGKFTNNITSLAVGSKAWIDGPYGVYTQELTHTTQPLILIAGGIGITPYLRHLHHLSSSNRQAFLFYGNQTVSDIAFEQDLNKSTNQNFKVVHVLSNEEAEGFAKGFVTVDLIKSHVGELANYLYFITGPKPMMDILSTGLAEQGVSSRQIYMEEFSL